jgi:hypothetical protein
MMSPTRMPFSAASLSGSTAVTTRPASLAASSKRVAIFGRQPGARRRQASFAQRPARQASLLADGVRRGRRARERLLRRTLGQTQIQRAAIAAAQNFNAR